MAVSKVLKAEIKWFL